MFRFTLSVLWIWLLLSACHRDTEPVYTPEEAALRDSVLYFKDEVEDFPRAADFAQQGMQRTEDRSIKHAWFSEMYHEAVTLDSFFTFAFAGVQSYYQKDYLRAAEQLERSLDYGAPFEQDTANAFFFGQLYSYLGGSYYQLGRYDLAEARLKPALDLLGKNQTPETRDHYYIAATLLISVYTSSGRFEVAEALLNRPELKESLITDEDYPDHSAVFYNARGQIEQYKGNLAEAAGYFQRAYTIDTNSFRRSSYLLNQAWIHLNQCQFMQSREAIRESFSLLNGELGYPDEVWARNRYALGWLRLQEGKYLQAANLFNEALNRLPPRHFQQPFYRFELAHAHSLAGKDSLAIHTYRHALKELGSYHRRYFPYLNERQQVNFFSQLKSRYERFISYVLTQQSGPPSHELSQPRLDDLYRLVLEIKSSLRLQAQQPNADTVPDRWQQILDRFQQAYSGEFTSHALDSLLRELRQPQFTKSPSGLSSSPFPQMDHSRIQQRLSPRSVAIEIVRYRKTGRVPRPDAPDCRQLGFTDTAHYAALLLRASGPIELIKLPESEHFEGSFYQDYLAALNQDNSDTLTTRTPYADDRSWKRFWQPLAKRLEGMDTVYLSPDGVYNHINLNGLRHPDGAYVMDRYHVHYLTSTLNLTLPELPASSKAGSLHHLYWWAVLALGLVLLLGLSAFYWAASRIFAVGLSLSAGIGLLIVLFWPLKPRALLVGYANHEMPINPHMDDPNIDPYSQKVLHGALDQVLNKIKNSRPLEATREEIQHAAFLLNSPGNTRGFPARVLLRNSARKNYVKSVQHPQVLHIATHGFYLEEQNTDTGRDVFQTQNALHPPINHLFRSGLVFSGDNRSFEDPAQYWQHCILTAYDVLNMQLNGTELVILSACESGLGPYRSGLSIHGLPGAFQAAGARSVIVSVLPVYDTTTQLFISAFYRHWQASGNKRAAFRAAQLEVRQVLPHPTHWAPLMLVE